MKAQASTELLMIVAGAMAVFVFLFFIMSGEISTVNQLKDTMDAFRISSELGAAVNAVWLAGDGARASIDLGEANATIWAANRTLNAKVRNSFYDWPLLAPTLNYTSIHAGALSITNSNGVVTVAAG